MIITKRVNISSLFFSFPNTEAVPQNYQRLIKAFFFPPSFRSVSLYLLQLSSLQSLYLNSSEDSTFLSYEKKKEETTTLHE